MIRHFAIVIEFFIISQICKLLLWWGRSFNYLFNYFKIYIMFIRLRHQGNTPKESKKIMSRFYSIKNIRLKIEERKCRIKINDLVVDISEQCKIPQYESRDFINNVFHLDA